MVKDPKRRRLKRLHKISDNRADIIKSGEPSANEDVTPAGSDPAKLPVTAPFNTQARSLSLAILGHTLGIQGNKVQAAQVLRRLVTQRKNARASCYTG